MVSSIYINNNWGIQSFRNTSPGAYSNSDNNQVYTEDNFETVSSTRVQSLVDGSGGINEPFDINLSVSSIAIELAEDPQAVEKIIRRAANLDATGGIAEVTANGLSTGVTASSTASGLFDITPTTVGTFNPASRALDAMNTIIGLIETNDVNAFAAIFEEEGVSISKAESAQIFNRLQKNQALIRTALTQTVAREGQRNTDLQRVAQVSSDRRSRSANLAQPRPNNNAGGGP
ncbi:MAG: hypothetical protein QNJ31_00295 [Candidatus Caenarcaniphilales bacterium]|nr:hypothetical protein [Candidatus Caenarcaniphilales bacterium]